MMFRSLLIAAAMLLALAPAQAADYRAYAEAIAAAPPEGVVFRDDLEAVLDARASVYRKKKRKPSVESSPLLEIAARAQALDMMANGKSGHRSRQGDGFQTRFAAFRPDPAMLYHAGENTASDRRRGAADEAKALRLFDLWIESSGHRANLLNDRFDYVSSGVVQRGTELWAVQIFWSRPIKSNMLFQ